MGESGFIDGLVKVMLSWARWLTNLVWSSFNSTPTEDGLVAWFGRNWLIIALLLVAVGIFIDWLVWMIRWRPYWLWFRKKQILYAEEDEIPLEEQEEMRRQEEEMEARWHLFSQRRGRQGAREEEEDPFAENTLIPTQEDRRKAAREQDDPFAPHPKKKKDGYHVMFDDSEKSRRHVMFEDENEEEDPFAEEQQA